MIVKMNFLSLFSMLFLVYYGEAIHSNDWWKYTTIYEVYIRSFMDSDGDGIGDLKGITSKLDHFVDLGVEMVWITPFFQSPMADTGYDVSNFTAVDPMFGDMDDFEELVEEMDKRGLKLLLDFAINHCSDEHEWFLKSIEKVDPYTDYYIWKDPKGYDGRGHPIPPNNWVSQFTGSAWKWNEKRKQFYYHQFSDKQPDFDLRNPVVRAELKNIFKFWFDKGVAGSRLDATIHFIEDLHFRDEELKDAYKNNPTGDPIWEHYDHKYTIDLWESYEFIHELREYVDKNCSTKNNEKLLIAEAYTTVNLTMAYYGTTDYKICHFPFNFDLKVEFTSFPNAKVFDGVIKRWLKNMPSHGVANWVTENHDGPRIGTLFLTEYMDIMIMTTLTLPGIAVIYYGQEIGMMDGQVRPDQRQDLMNDASERNRSRDYERLPMQWDDSINAGFTSNLKPWLPVNPDYWHVNVEAQKQQPRSRYNNFKNLLKLRRTKTLKYGNFQSYLVSTWVYAFSRSLAGEPTYITILNLGTETEMIHLHQSIPNLPAFVRVHSASMNAGYLPGEKVYTHPKYPQTFILRPMSVLVVSAKK